MCQSRGQSCPGARAAAKAEATAKKAKAKKESSSYAYGPYADAPQAIGNKVTDALETKRQELAKGFVNNHIPEPEDDKNI